MGVNMRNSEGYYDPTAYLALTKIEQEAKAARAFLPVVYICSPLSGAVEVNQAKARGYCRFAVDSGYIPLPGCCPFVLYVKWFVITSRPAPPKGVL